MKMKNTKTLIALLVALIGGVALPVSEAKAWDVPPLKLHLCNYQARATVCYSSSFLISEHDEICEIERIGTRNSVVAGGGMVIYPEASTSRNYGYTQCNNHGYLESSYGAGYPCCATAGEYRHSNTRWVKWEEGSTWGIHDEDFVIAGQWLVVTLSTCQGSYD